MPRLSAFLAALIFVSFAAASESVPLPGERGFSSMGTYVEVLEDPTGALRLEDVRAPERAARFTRPGADPLNFGYSRSAWWLRFRLPGGAPAGEELLLEVAFPSIDRIELHRPEAQPGGEPRYWARLAGDSFPWDAREVRHRNYVFRLPAPTAPGEHEYYMRVQSKSVVTVPLTLWRPEAFAEQGRNVQLLLGLFYGLALALILYNLMLFAAVRDGVYAYYVAYAVAFGLFLFSYDGLAYQYLWPGSVWAANHAVAMTLCLTLALGVLFARGFLATRRVTLAGREVRLTPTEYRLLVLLARHPDRVLTHRQLLKEIWGPNATDQTHYLRVYMGQLRHKLEPDPARPRTLLTETGIGYRLRTEPAPSEGEA